MKHPQKINIYHIHSDDKFVQSSRLFYFDFAQNHIFFIGNPASYRGSNKAGIRFFSKDKTGVKQIIHECAHADMVVVYELNYLKAYIVNRLTKSTKIFWRFFGTELYTRIKQQDIFSLQTLQFLQSAQVNRNYLANKFLNPLKHWLKWQTNIKSEFKKAMRRIDFFIGMSELEHRYLRERFPELPPFFQYPFLESNIEETVTVTASNRIIIGNNKSAFNNHLDILDILKRVKNTYNLECILLFNYGVENKYTHEVKARAALMDCVTVVEDFMDREEFKKFYDNVCGLVINGYRQMAMGNIFVALRKGIKVYLNENNVIYRWLLNEGFSIYNVNELSEDISTGEFRLDLSVAEHNRKQFIKLVKKYNHERFRTTIYELAFAQKQRFLI